MKSIFVIQCLSFNKRDFFCPSTKDCALVMCSLKSRLTEQFSFTVVYKYSTTL